MLETQLEQINALENCREEINELMELDVNSPQFINWQLNTKEIIEDIFGRNSNEWNRFSTIDFAPRSIDRMMVSSWKKDYQRGLKIADGTLESFIIKIKRKQVKKVNISVKYIIPNEIIIKFPTEIQTIVYEINGCYNYRFYMACSVMCRKAIEASIYLKLKMDDKENELRDKNGNVISYPKKIELARKYDYISPPHIKQLKKIKLFGDAGAHNFKISIIKDDLENEIKPILRLVLDEIFSQ